MSASELVLSSCAKINWSLEILGKRSDGYHEVCTVLQTISLHDTLHFATRKDGRIVLTCDTAEVPANENNLVVRAAMVLRATTQSDYGANIHLGKQIPVQAGLGGASSNAAIALLGLNQLWQLELRQKELLSISRALGADVPFFLIGGTVLATGIGTELESLGDVDQQWLIVITPNARISTPKAYDAVRADALTSPNSASILARSRAKADLFRSKPWRLRNDFEQVIFEIEPEIERVRRALLDVGAGPVLLAGSGSSVFGVFESEEVQRRAMDSLVGEMGWRIFPCVSLPRREYVQAVGSAGLFPSSNNQFDIGA